MMRGSMVARKIDLEDKRVCAPFPMIQEPFFALPVVPAPTIPEVEMQAPVLTSPVTTMGKDPEPVHQEPTEPVVEHEREVQQPLSEDETLRSLKELRNQPFLLIIKFTIQK